MGYFEEASGVWWGFIALRMELQMFVSHSEHLRDLKEMCTEDSNDILGMEKGDHFLQIPK
jgi:hypothetical protein